MHIGRNNHQFVAATIPPVTLRLYYAMQQILSAERLRKRHPTLVYIRLRWNSGDSHCKD